MLDDATLKEMLCFWKNEMSKTFTLSFKVLFLALSIEQAGKGEAN